MSQSTQPNEELREHPETAAQEQPTPEVALEVKTGVRFYGFGSAGVKAAFALNSAVPNSKELQKSGKLIFFAVDSDGGFLQNQEKLNNSKTVQKIFLLDEDGCANGTGGMMEEGERRAQKIMSTIQEHVIQAKTKKEVVLMFGCAGGGTVKAMEVFAKAFRDRDILTLIILAKPTPDYGGEYIEAFTQMNQSLLMAGAVLCPIENNQMAFKGTNPIERYKALNNAATLPVMQALLAVFLTVADCTNADLSDLKRILKPGHYFTVCVYGNAMGSAKNPEQTPEQKEHKQNAEAVIKELTAPRLQFKKAEIIASSTQGLIWSNGFQDDLLIHQVTKKISEKMDKDEAADTSISPKVRVKQAIHVGGENEPQWIAFITAAKLDSPYEDGLSTKIEGQKAHTPTANFKVQTTVRSDELPSPQTIKTEILMEGPNAISNLKPVLLPENLINEMHNLTNGSSTADQGHQVITEVNRYLKETSQLPLGWKAILSLKTRSLLRDTAHVH